MHKLTIHVEDKVFERLREGKGASTEEEYAADIVRKRFFAGEEASGKRMDEMHERVIERLDELEGRIRRLNALLLR